jgi:hypothetical protein
MPDPEIDPSVAARTIVENAIAELLSLGMNRPNAVMLLAFQSLIRVEDIEDLEILRDEAQTKIDTQLDDDPDLH